MSKYFRKRKMSTQSIIAIFVVAIIVLGVVFALVLTFNSSDNSNEEKVTVSPTFVLGGLDEQGKYVQSEKTLYTKDVIDHEALDFELEFDATISYKVFFYDEKDKFVSATEDFTESGTVTLPDGALYSRIMITPDWTGVPVVDQKIDKISKYTSQMIILANNEDYVNTKTFTLFGNGAENSQYASEIVPVNYEEYKLDFVLKGSYTDCFDAVTNVDYPLFLITFLDADYKVFDKYLTLTNESLVEIYDEISDSSTYYITFTIESLLQSAGLDVKDASSVKYLIITTLENTNKSEITLTAVEAE